MNIPKPGFAPSTRARFSIADFLRVIEAEIFQDETVELIDGEIERMQKPKNLHAARQAKVVFRLAGVSGVDLVRGGSGLDLGEDTFLVADAAPLREPMIESRWLVASDLELVVGIAETTADRDLGLKRRKYASAGVPHYWVVDGARSVIHVFDRPQGGDYRDIDLVRFGEPLAVPGTDATIVLE